MSTNTRASENSWFDPPIENYRFYYQGGGTTLTDRNSAKGFVLKTQRTMQLEGSMGSARGNKSAHMLSSSSRNLFGSTISRGGGAASMDRSDDNNSQNTSSYQ